MFPEGQSYTRSYPAVADSVPLARSELSHFVAGAGADRERLEAIKLSASEAITNAVLHAYPAGRNGASEHSFQVTASHVEDDVWVLIADEGTGLRPRTRSEGLGVGLVLIAQLADDFRVLSRGCGGTELSMRFKLRSAPEPDADLQPRGSVASAVAPA